MKRILLGLLILLCATVLNVRAQQDALQIWTPPRLVITNPAAQDIELRQVSLRGEVSARHAETEISLTFFNPNNRVLEGELQFPLLDGQTIIGFAMDVNGEMRDAVPVEKARGQQVFEEIVRGNVDPGLLEVTQGNNFKLRVYPIPAQGSKRVVLRIQETLPESAAELSYRLPLGFAQRVAEFSIDIQIHGAQSTPTIIAGTFAQMEITRAKSAWRIAGTQRDFVGSGLLQLGIPVSQQTVVSTQMFAGKTYFVADLPLPSRRTARELPKTIGLIWDASSSGATRNHGRELELLNAYLKKLGNGKVHLTRIRNIADPVQVFSVVDGSWQTLRKALEETIYDGATKLDAFVPQTQIGEYLLFSDGLSNYGDSPFARTSVPLYTICSAQKSDSTFLRHIAQRSGAQFVDLSNVSNSEAAQTLLNAGTRVENLRATGASSLVMASPFPRNGRLQIAGVLDRNDAVIELASTTQDGKRGRSSNLRIEIAKFAEPGRSAARQWAQMQLLELDGEYFFNRAQIRRLGVQFGLLTRETSLIVLDNISDYVRYEIEPPNSMRDVYQKLLAVSARQQSADRSAHLENVVRQFEDKITWWQRDFPKNDRHQAAMKIANDAAAAVVGLPSSPQLSAQRERRANQAVAAPPPPAAESAPAALESVIVTGSRVHRADNVADESKSEADLRAQPSTKASIRLQAWNPDSTYARRIRAASTEQAYRIYLDERDSYQQSTAFYLDVADVLLEKGLGTLALRVLSNLAEMDLENRHVLRVLAYRLIQAKQPQTAILILKKVLALSPNEPQSYRDLGLAYAQAEQAQLAIDQLNEVLVRPWHDRFPGVEQIVLAELNAIIAASKSTLDTSAIDSRLLRNLPLDLRVVLSWDADNTDIDLWVTDPNNEKAYYGNRLSHQGGRMTQDFTGGYGPEEFSLKSAKPGKYKVEAQYYGSRQQTVSGVTTLQMRLSSHFASPRQQDQLITLRLKAQSETVFVGEFEIE